MLSASASGAADARVAAPRFSTTGLPRRLSASTTNAYKTAEDEEASELAQKRAVEFCQYVDLSGIDREDGREMLVAGVGDSNFIVDILKKSKTPDEFGEKVNEELDPTWAFQTAGTLVVALLVGLTWYYVCYTACPCCRRCRVLDREHKCPMPGKVVYLIVLMLLAGCAAGAGFYGYGGKNMIEEGMDSLSCTAARVLNFTVNGNSEHNFIGMLPMLDEFANLKSILDDGSGFITGMDTIMDQTKEIEQATFVAAEATGLLKKVLEETGNVHPVPTVSSDSTLHKCVLCEQLAPLLANAKTELENGVAAALSSAREEVEEQMSPTNRKTLRDSFDTSITPLTEAKDMVRDTTKAFLTDDFMATKETILFAGAYSANAVSICIFGIGGCALIGSICCIVKENSDKRSDEEKAAAPPQENPYNRWIAPCAGVTWCCAFLYAFFVFLLAGLMIVAAVPFSSFCLVMDDIDSQLLQDIGPGLGLDTTGPDMVMIGDMVDTCFSRITPPSNKSLMDIVFITENGTQVTLKEKIQGQTTEMINKQFEQVDVMLASGNVLLLENPNVTSLLDFLDTPFDAAIVPESQQGGPVLSSSTYNKVGLDPRTGDGSGVEIAFGTSLSCTDFLYKPPTGASTNVFGINSLKAKLQGFTSSALLPSSPVGTCTNKVDCNLNPVTNSAINCNLPTTQQDVLACQACQSANDWMDLKAQLESSNSYRCDVFQHPNGADCDVLSMSQDSNNLWTDDCLQSITAADGTVQYMMTPKAKPCNLAEFKSYMANWKARLTLAYGRVDQAQESTKSGIQVSLKDHVDKYVTTPVNNMVLKAEGSFLKKEYGDFVDALCYKGVVGFRKLARAYAANGTFTLFLILFSYGLWRHGIDNRNSWRDKNNGLVAPDSVVPIESGDKPGEAWQT